MKARTLSTIVDDLHRLPPDRIGIDTVLEVLAGGAIDEASLQPYVGFRSDRYARRVVHRSDLFDVMAICWSPGQLGWVRLVRRRIEEDS